MKIENELEFKQRLITLLEKRFEESYPFKKVCDGIFLKIKKNIID